MASACDIAIDLLPHFEKHVLARQQRSYGVYAASIGRDPAKESLVVGMAMHMIGAVCVLGTIPVAPLHFVERADGEWRGVFESDPLEAIHVLPHYNLLYTTARGYKYSAADFARIKYGLTTFLPERLPSTYISPHHVWHWVIVKKTKGHASILERALAKYRDIQAELKSA